MSDPSGMSSRLVLPSPQLPVPEASVVTRLTTQVLVPMLLGFGMGSGAPKRQPVRLPVQVPVPQSVLVRHGAPAKAPPTQAMYSGSLTLAEVQVRLVIVALAVESAGVVAPSVRAPVVVPHMVILVYEVPWSGTTEGSGVPTPDAPK